MPPTDREALTDAEKALEALYGMVKRSVTSAEDRHVATQARDAVLNRLRSPSDRGGDVESREDAERIRDLLAYCDECLSFRDPEETRKDLLVRVGKRVRHYREEYGESEAGSGGWATRYQQDVCALLDALRRRIRAASTDAPSEERCTCVDPSPHLPGDSGVVMECPVHGEVRFRRAPTDEAPEDWPWLEWLERINVLAANLADLHPVEDERDSEKMADEVHNLTAGLREYGEACLRQPDPVRGEGEDVGWPESEVRDHTADELLHALFSEVSSTDYRDDALGEILRRLRQPEPDAPPPEKPDTATPTEPE